MLHLSHSQPCSKDQLPDKMAIKGCLLLAKDKPPIFPTRRTQALVQHLEDLRSRFSSVFGQILP